MRKTLIDKGIVEALSSIIFSPLPLSFARVLLHPPHRLLTSSNVVDCSPFTLYKHYKILIITNIFSDMKRLFLLVLWCIAFTATAQQTDPSADLTEEGYLPKPVQVGDVFPIQVASAHPYNVMGTQGIVFEQEFYNKSSHYIKLYFERFDLAPGDYVELLGMNSGERVIYSQKGKIVDQTGRMISQFWSQIIFDERVRVRLYSQQASAHYGFDLTQVAYGYPEAVVQQRLGLKTVCGSDDKENIVCYNGTTMYDKGRAVCRLFIGGGGACTGWLLGCEGHVMTNNHCIGSATSAQNTDYVFNFEFTTCAAVANASSDVVASSATFIKTNSSLDYTLVRLPSNPTSTYGFLSLSSVAPVLNDRIYIVGHPGGRRKEITVNTDRGGVGGFAAVDQVTTNGIRYFADTEGGSSGSPVLSFTSNLVVSIHNTGSCTIGNGSAARSDRLIAHIGNDMPNCGIDSGSTVVPTCGSTVTNFPYTEGFESSFGAWRQVTGEGTDWTRNSGTTLSNNTGPNGASQGITYAYIEATGNFPNVNAQLLSPCFDLTNITYPQLVFDYHMYGADMGTLEVEVSTNGAIWNTVWTASGDQGQLWITDTIDLNAYTNESGLLIRFSGTTAGGFTSDMSIDDIKVEQGVPACTFVNTFPYTEDFENTLGLWTQDAGDDFDWTINSGGTPSNNTGPSAANSGTYYIYTEATGNNPSREASLISPCFNLTGIQFPELNFDYHMFGASMGTLFVEASIGGGTWTTVWSRTGNQGNAWSTATVDLSAYRNRADLRLRLRGVTGNGFASDIAVDGLSLGEPLYSCPSTVNTYPYNEGFETGLGMWSQDNSDDFNWTRNSGGTGSSGTGPSAASEGIYYVYTEASDPNNPSKVAILNSPCFDLTNTTAPVLSFDYHMNGTGVGNLVLEARTASTNWATIWSRAGNRGSNWLSASVPLSAYQTASNLRFRFRVTTGTSWSSDIAVDDILLDPGRAISVQNIAAERPQVMVAPNPFRDYLEVTTNIQEVMQYQIMSVDGKVVQEGQLQGTQSLPVARLQAGVYFIRFSNETQQFTHKVIKQ